MSAMLDPAPLEQLELKCEADSSAIGFQGELRDLVCFFVLGVLATLILRATVPLTRRKAKVSFDGKLRASEPLPSTPIAAAAIAFRLPPELSTRVAGFSKLADLAALALVDRAAAALLWHGPGAWQTLAARSGLKLSLNAEAGPGDAREAFRRRAFRVDGKRLLELGRASESATDGTWGHVAALEEAARLARGLLPSDGEAPVAALCRVGEQALRMHDTICPPAARAAERFLDLARGRPDLLSEAQLEQLEAAHSSSLQLQALLDASVEQHPEQLDPWEASARAEEAATRSVDASLDAEYEAQHRAELDALLDDLQQRAFQELEQHG